jgi:hypothetical protein
MNCRQWVVDVILVQNALTLNGENQCAVLSTQYSVVLVRYSLLSTQY